MAVRSCMRTCVDDSVRVVAFCQIIAATAALVFAVRMIVEDGIMKTGAWKDLSQTWFVLAVTLYGLALVRFFPRSVPSLLPSPPSLSHSCVGATCPLFSSPR